MGLDIRAVGVTKGKKKILGSVSCTLFGGLTYLIGLNGSGKTTLLRCLAGIAPYDGSIHLHQQELRQYAPRHLARQLAFVQQHINLPPHTETYDFVLMGRYPYLNWWGTYAAFDHQHCRQAMERLDVWELRNRRLTEISGGELQRVLLARALTQDTPLLLLDEPAQSLDPRHRRFVYQLLREVAAEGRTVICSTHDLEAIAVPGSRVIGLHAGDLIWDAPSGEIPPRLLQAVYGLEA